MKKLLLVGVLVLSCAVARLGAEPVKDYASLTAAISAAQAGAEIEVWGEIELTGTINLNKAITVKSATGRAADAVFRARSGMKAVSATNNGAMLKDVTITGVSDTDCAVSLNPGAVLSGCVISNNTVTAAVVDGGIVSRCLLSENVCDRVFNGNSRDKLSGVNNSLVVSNTFTSAIFRTAYNGMFIENNTVVDNRAASDTAGLYKRENWGTHVVVNCIFWNNTCQDGTRMASQSGSSSSSYSGLNPQMDSFVMNNNFEEYDPRLDENFRPTRFSPGIESGVIDFVWTDRERFHTLDFDGRERILGGSMDMGAFEFDPSSVESTTVFYVSTAGNDETGDGTEGAPFASLAKAASLAAFGDTIRISAGTYEQTEETVLAAGVRVEGVGSVTISNTGEASATSRLLTIRSGAAVLSGVTLSGGNCTSDASALVVTCGTVTNCVITGNKSTTVPVISLGASPCALLTHCDISNNEGVGNGFVCNSIGAQAAVRHSVLRNNTLKKQYCGGLCYGVRMADCEISDNTANSWSQEGTCAYKCIVKRCVIKGNNGLKASALRDSFAYDCLVANNTCTHTDSSAAVLDSILYNCTVVGNTGAASSGAYGVKRGTAYNSIIWNNTKRDGSVTNNVDATALYYCCTDETVGENADCNKEGNIFSDPILQDSFKLEASSPCVNAGSEDYRRSEIDLAGKSRVVAGTVDMGCYEKSLDDVFTATVTGFEMDGNTAAVSGFILAPDGEYSISWDFGDGSATDAAALTITGGGGAAVSIGHTYAGPRLYPVTITLRDGDGRVTTSDAITVVVRLASGEIYVSPEGSDWNPGTADAPLKTAEGARLLASVGMTVRFAPGEYDLDYEFKDAVTLVGCGEKPEDVVIRKTTKSASRLITLSDAAQEVRNLTLEGGVHTGDGGAVYIAAGTLRDCIVRNSTASGTGGGIYLENSDSASVVSCVVSNTTAKGSGYSVGAGGVKATVEKSILRDGGMATGSPQYTSGGCYLVTLKDCLITKMNCPVWSHNGAGAYKCVLYRCVVTENDGWIGGALSDCTAYDCLISDNISSYDRSWSEVLPAVYNSTLYNCTVVGNRSRSNGSFGVSGGSAYNCIIVGNTSLDGTVTSNYTGTASLHRCCTWPAVEDDANGNIFEDPQLKKGYIPASSSPCVNAGISKDATLGATYFPNASLRTCDLAGNPRVKGTEIDIGCYEYMLSGLILLFR